MSKFIWYHPKKNKLMIRVWWNMGASCTTDKTTKLRRKDMIAPVTSGWIRVGIFK